MTVRADDTLLDTHQTSAINRVGTDTLQQRITTLPGRSLADVVNTEPGWLLEANGILHPRGSEYQVQYVVDGLPVTDNRSPSFAPELDADDVHSMSILTGGYRGVRAQARRRHRSGDGGESARGRSRQRCRVSREFRHRQRRRSGSVRMVADAVGD